MSSTLNSAKLTERKVKKRENWRRKNNIKWAKKGHYANSVFPMMHLICPPKFCITFKGYTSCFSFLLGITAAPREIENNAYAEFWGANKVHYGKKSVLNLSALGKIFTIVLLQNVCNFRETVGLSPYRNNGSTYFCPSFGKITLRWYEFHPFTHYNSSSKALEGNLIHYMRKALNIDIYVLSKFGDHSWKSRYQQLLWDGDPDPPYSTRRTKYIFRFLPTDEIVNSFKEDFSDCLILEGPAVLKVNHGIASSSNETLYFLKEVWTIVVISFSHAVLAGMIIWYLVCTSRHSFNSYQ